MKIMILGHCPRCTRSSSAMITSSLTRVRLYLVFTLITIEIYRKINTSQFQPLRAPQPLPDVHKVVISFIFRKYLLCVWFLSLCVCECIERIFPRLAQPAACISRVTDPHHYPVRCLFATCSSATGKPVCANLLRTGNARAIYGRFGTFEPQVKVPNKCHRVRLFGLSILVVLGFDTSR